jgi:Fur family ferric uptake transcriptional regulator
LKSEELKNAGLKVTLPRVKILEILKTHPDLHMSAEDVYKTLLNTGEEIGLATVYRVLTHFEASGIVKRHNFEGNQSVFELDQGGHHDHMVCLDCGRIEEFNDDVIERQQQTIAKKLGFELAEHCLILYGNCTKNDCPYRRRESA